MIDTQIEDHVAVITLNRPEALNALSPQLMEGLCAALEQCDHDSAVRIIILTGSEHVFAAGADIKTLSQATPTSLLKKNTRQYWERVRGVSKPIIAAVSGFAYGGGCELAMACDLIVASESARFAQPEIRLGIMPGAGGTQRLVKALGPYRAMEMVLTGEPITAQEAYQFGLVNRVVPVERLMDTALELGRLIAARPPLAIRLAREALRYGIEAGLREGLEVERRNYLLLYATEDQKEGMAAFLEKREPRFRGS